MDCPKCGAPVNVHPGQAAYIPPEATRPPLPQGYISRFVACLTATCDNVYQGRCDWQAAGGDVNGSFVEMPALVPLATLMRIFADAGLEPHTFRLPPEQKDLPDHENPQHDPGE